MARALDAIEREEGEPTNSQQILELFHRLGTRDRHGGDDVKREWQRLGELLVDRGVDV